MHRSLIEPLPVLDPLPPIRNPSRSFLAPSPVREGPEKRQEETNDERIASALFYIALP